MRSQEAVLVDRWTLPWCQRIPLGLHLSSTYVATPTDVCYSEGANVRQLDSVLPGDGLWENVTVGDIMDTTGGRLCYTYA